MSDSPAPSLLARLWHKLPGPTHAVRGLWLFHALVIVGLIILLRELKVPSDERWAARIATGKPQPFRDYLALGLYYGGFVYLALSALVLLTVRWWGRLGGGVCETRWQLGTRTGRWFWPVLLLIVIAAGILRWPRMSHSYWGDEGWALREYVHGEYWPVQGKDMQGELKFMQVPWLRVFFDDHTAGNHYAFSILQRLTLDAWRAMKGLPEPVFDEVISRLPAFAFGMASLVIIACFFRWLGSARVGVIVAVLLSLHSWHIRYSTEARGYSIMFCCLILLVWAALLALRTGRWRWWIAFGVLEFLCMYSWKGVMYPLAALNVALGAWLLWSNGMRDMESGTPATKRERWTSIARLLAVNVMAGALFIFLTTPCALQIKDAKAKLVQLIGKPMDAHWLHNSLSGVVMGMPWERDDRENPTETVLNEAIAKQPGIAGLGLAAEVALLLTGCVLLCLRRRLDGLLWTSVALSVIIAALCFKYLFNAEWIYWYSFYVVLPLAIFKAYALDALIVRGLSAGATRPVALFCLAVVVALPALSAVTSWPHTRLMETQPYESHRNAWQLTRGQHEPLGFTGPSKVYTRYLWRYIHLYDPRSDGHVRDGATLRELMAKVDAEHGELYFTVGQRDLSKGICPEVMALLADEKLFQLKATLWAEQEIHTLAVYHYRGAQKAVP